MRMKKYNYYHYNKNLRAYARKLRNDSTKAEIKIWSALLSAKQMMGYSFLRQRPIGNYIVDFFCKELMLVIEVDGLTHHWEETYEKDLRKEDYLRSLGYSILRFDDCEVINHIEQVSDCIQNFIFDYLETHPPSPLDKGEI